MKSTETYFYEIFYDGKIPEKTEIKYLKKLLVGCDRFIDVGANLGLYSFFANKYLKNSEIILIEANHTLNRFLEEAISKAKNENDNGNHFSIINNVVLDVSGTNVPFPIENGVGGSIFTNIKDSKLSRIKSVKLDDFFDPNKRTVIKIDIEGAEYRAIKGATNFLNSKNTKFFCELHGWGDEYLKKFPLNVANTFFINGYGIKKIGAHYLFEGVSLPKRIISYCRFSPLLFAKFMLYRFFPYLVPVFKR